MLAINAVPPSDYLVADKGYDSNALRSWLIERGTTPVIPSKSNRKVQIDHDRQICPSSEHLAQLAAEISGVRASSGG